MRRTKKDWGELTDSVPWGTHDDVEFYVADNLVYAFTSNSYLEYIGISVLNKDRIEDGWETEYFSQSVQDDWEDFVKDALYRSKHKSLYWDKHDGYNCYGYLTDNPRKVIQQVMWI